MIEALLISRFALFLPHFVRYVFCKNDDIKADPPYTISCGLSSNNHYFSLDLTLAPRKKFT